MTRLRRVRDECDRTVAADDGRILSQLNRDDARSPDSFHGLRCIRFRRLHRHHAPHQGPRFFLRPVDVERTLEHFRNEGFETKRTYPHWLAKVRCGEDYLDLIYRAGNGLCEIDDSWFERAHEDEVLGCKTLICPPEELIWTKSFIMERERFDGADVLHLIQSCAERLDWGHLVRRFGQHWRVLLSHLILFGYVYPTERHRIPTSIMTELLQRAQKENAGPAPNELVCRGTLLARPIPGGCAGTRLYGCAPNECFVHVRRGHRALDRGDQEIELNTRLAFHFSLVSAEGAIFIFSLGQRPRGCRKVRSAESATQTVELLSRHESRFQRWNYAI